MENNTLGSRLGTRYPEPSNPIESLASWLKSLAPQTAAVQPEPKKTASPSAVEASRLSRFVDDIKARLGEEPPTGELAAVPGRTEIPQRRAPRPERAFDDEFPAGAEAPTWALPAGRVGANMAEHYRGGSGQAPAMVSGGPTFDQAFPANPSWPANAGPQPPRAAPTRRAPSAGALGGSAPAAQAPSMPPAPAPVAAATPVVASDAPAEAKRKSLLDMYKELVKDLPKDATGDLTPQQKSRMQMDFFMNLLARSSKPGAYALGAAGEAGLDTSKAATDQENKNYDRSRNANNDARGEAMRMLGLEDKDQDNIRGDKRTAAEQARWEAIDRRDQARLDLQRDIFESGSWQAVNNGKTGTIHLLNTKNGTTKDTGIKIDRGDTRSAEEKLIDRAAKDPDFRKAMLELKGKTGDVTESGVFKAGLELIKGDTSGKYSNNPSNAMDVARRLAAAAGGNGPAARGNLSRKDPKYAEALKDPRVGGDKKKLDAMLQQNGYSLTD